MLSQSYSPSKLKNLKKNLPKLFIISSVIAASTYYFEFVSSLNGQATLDRWWSRWTLATILMAVAYLVFLAKRTRPLVLPLMLPTVLMSVYQVFWKHHQSYRVLPFTHEGKALKYFVPHHIPNFAQQTLETLFLCMLILTVIVTAKKTHLKLALKTFAWIGFANSLFILYRFFDGVDSYWRTGFVVYNASMDSMLVALTYPLMLKNKKYFNLKTFYGFTFIMSPILAVIAAQKWIGFGCMILVLLTIAAQKLKVRPWKIMLLVPSSLAAMWGVSYLRLVDSTGRISIWEHSIKFLIENDKLLTGFGLGHSFQNLRLVQKLHSTDVNLGIYGWMHNKWLEVLFEQGLIGLICFAGLYALTLHLSFKRYTYLVPVVVATGFAMGGNWIFHFSTTAIYTTIVAGLILKSNKGYKLSYE